METPKYEPVIGMEMHIELSTKSKMFCACKNDPFRAKKPNSYTCPTCLGLPGALPVPNEKAVDWTIMIGLALNCKIANKSKFDRKHYFYPDLPKGYQISQYDEPLCSGGFVETSQGRVGITRVHLEEDTAKLMHKKINGKNKTLIDFNRSGVPLVEIVTEPDIKSPEQAKEFLKKVHAIVKALGVSDASMETGSMRLEANSSMRKKGEKALPKYKVEVKNLNSFKYVKQALEYDFKRQEKLLLKGQTPKQETRGWDEDVKKTVGQRSKETAQDYRYFPEPDIPPLEISEDKIKEIKNSMPVLPEKTKDELIQLGVREDYAELLSTRKSSADLAIEVAEEIKVKEEVNSMVGTIIREKLTKRDTSAQKLIAETKTRKEETIGDETSLLVFVKEIMEKNKKAVNDYKNGKEEVIGFLVGQVMGKTKGKADPKVVQKILKERLKK